MSAQATDRGGLACKLEPSQSPICFCCVRQEDRIVKVIDHGTPDPRDEAFEDSGTD